MIQRTAPDDSTLSIRYYQLSFGNKSNAMFDSRGKVTTMLVGSDQMARATVNALGHRTSFTWSSAN